MQKKVKSVDQYLEQVKAPEQVLLRHLRKMIIRLVPEAEEVISYNMPAYKFHGMLIGFAALKNHCSLYMWKGGVTSKFKNELADYELSEGTIRFTVEHPLPDSLIEKIVLYRKEENLSKKKDK